jgi:hypothetical protein
VTDAQNGAKKGADGVADVRPARVVVAKNASP